MCVCSHILPPVLQLRKDKWISVINVIEYGDIADFKAEQKALVSVSVYTGLQLCISYVEYEVQWHTRTRTHAHTHTHAHSTDRVISSFLTFDPTGSFWFA